MLTPLEVVTAPAGIVLVRFPLTFIVTLRVSVQFELAERLPPLNVNEPSPGFPESAPPQAPTEKFVGVAKNIPVGIVSVKVIPLNDVLFGLINITLMVEAEPPKTVRGLKPFTRPIEISLTVSLAEASSPGLTAVPVL